MKNLPNPATLFLLAMMSLLVLRVTAHEERIPQGEPYIMNCITGSTDSAPDIREWDQKPPYWILPNMKRVHAAWMDNDLNREVTPDGMRLLIDKVQYDFFGTYSCIITLKNGDYIEFKHALRLSGKFKSHWERYRMGVSIGGAAAFGFLLAVGVVLIVNKLRWRPPKRAPASFRNKTHVNPAFVGDYDEPIPTSSQAQY